MIDLLDPDSGLMQELLNAGCISQEQKNHIASENTSRERNSRIIECLREKDEFYLVALVDCLKRTKQQRLTLALMQSAGWIIVLFEKHLASKD